MKFEVLRAAVGRERQQWLAAIERLPVERRDVYFLPEYLEAFRDSTGAAACCAMCSHADAILLYPFLRHEIRPQGTLPAAGQRPDISSPYGFGGPVVNVAGEAPTFLQAAWQIFADWCSKETVVSEFVRFHPLLDNVRWAPASMETRNDRVTVPIMLQSYPTDVWNDSYYRVHRHMLRRAERAGFNFDVMDMRTELCWFVPLYSQTQEVLQAGPNTRLGMDYFSSLADGFGSRAWLGTVRHLGEVVAAVVVLEAPTYLHSHLMGYRRDMPTAGMTNLLYHGIALEGAKRGKAALHMGGGRTSSAADSLLEFKASLSPARRYFWTGTRCYAGTRS